MAKNNRYLQRHKENEQSAAATKHINFGAVVFMIIFLYIVIMLISFAVKESVNYTIAETGILSHSAQYQGLVIRDEIVMTSNDSGHLKYFFPEGARVRNNNPVFGVVTDPSMMALLDEQIFKANQNLSAADPIFDESYEFLRNRIKNYVINQHNQAFGYTYEAKKQIENDITEIRNTVIIQQSKNEGSDSHINLLENQYNEAVSLVKASRSGLISYKIDGLEHISIDTFKLGDIKLVPTVQDTTTKTMTEANQPVFKIVDNYLWYIAAEIDDECEKQIEGKNYIGVDFVDKDLQLDVKIYDVIDDNGKTYLILEIDRMVNQFLSDRNVNFRITYENYQGIKIPEAAVTSKTFAVIPIDYLIFVDKHYAVPKKTYSKDALGQETIAPIPVKIFKKQGDDAYVPIDDQLAVGDVLSATDNLTYETTEFIIEDTIDLEGVYVINKGFAVFKFIETNYKESDYRIVSSNIDYGVRIYDRIATEGELTKEYQIIN